jgi:SAM-dependent methyltransferase
VDARAEALPSDPNSFDAVLFSHVLHHLEDPGVAVREAARVLTPGGAFLIRFASHADLRADPRVQWMPRLLESALLAIPDTPRIAALVEDAGLSVVSVDAVETPACGTLEEFAEDVALQAAREWAMRGDSSPDPRPEARRWAADGFAAPPPVRESLLLARKPPSVA